MANSQVFFLLKEPMLTAVHSRDESCGPFKMHTHTFAELYCIVEGKGTFYVEGSQYDLHPGDVMLMRPGEAHYIQVDPSIPYERICITFNINLLSNLDPENALLVPYFDRAAGVYNHYTTSSKTLSLLRNAVAPGNSLATVSANLILILQQLCQDFGEKPRLDSRKNSVEYRIIEHINRHLDEDLTIERLCELFYLSRAQLCRRFQNATGTSIGKYVTAKRLIQARQMILQGQKPTDIYTACGYSDYATFYRAYRNYFGCSPKQAALSLNYESQPDLS